MRLRSLTASLAGTSAGTGQLVVRDGASGTGTIIWQVDLQLSTTLVNAYIELADLDLRATPGNALTVEFVAGTTSDQQAVNANGDYVPTGWPVGLP